MIGRRLLFATAAGVAAALLAPGSGAAAHPLGNFSVNHAHALTISAARLVDHAVVDYAEIPTAQRIGDIDGDGDGELSSIELERYGSVQCAALRDAMEVTVDAVTVELGVDSTAYTRPEGQAGLATGRLECTFSADLPLDLARSASSTIVVADEFEADRVGWREITAVADGVALFDAPVGTVSPTDALRSYPDDLLADPLDVRRVELQVGPLGSAPAASTPQQGAVDTSARDASRNPIADLVRPITRTFDDLVGRQRLTWGVGVLAVALSMVLGASHALLPGHGKTVMAAYIAGRQGTARDAVFVGMTVTATHTGGVLLVGLALTTSSALAGESVMAVLGVVSGGIIVALGAGMWWSVLRGTPDRVSGHHHGGHHHHGDHHHHGGPHHGHQHPPSHALSEQVRAVAAGSTLLSTPGLPASLAGAARGEPVEGPTAPDIARPVAPRSRWGLIGMGLAGGLVPSPSALVVLLSAIALGRTAFGVLLVIGYGVGMAATLTLAGLLLVRVRDALHDRSIARGASHAWLRWRRLAPPATATLVLLVGVGIVLRSIPSV